MAAFWHAPKILPFDRYAILVLYSTLVFPCQAKSAFLYKLYNKSLEKFQYNQNLRAFPLMKTLQIAKLIVRIDKATPIISETVPV